MRIQHLSYFFGQGTQANLDPELEGLTLHASWPTKLINTDTLPHQIAPHTLHLTKKEKNCPVQSLLHFGSRTRTPIIYQDPPGPNPMGPHFGPHHTASVPVR